jgi:murein L,D-transpeptidase YafK
LTGCTPVRALMTAAVLAAGVLLSGCNGESLLVGEKATRPIPDKLLADIETKNMDKASPILVRVFKQEAELEVWKQDRTGRFALLKTYPICRWSGDLGPKVKEGDRQAPEGFYSITPGQMNPNSGFYLSFNTGFPNAYDRAWNRSGSQLMVHGDCSSRGCYAMTDEQISEIYSLGRESFFGGQVAFQFQAYPFRMNPQNLARHRNNPNMAFWKMIKEGNDAFEVTKQEPKVDFCEKKYVFNAEQSPNAKRPPVFSASAKCPDYSVNDEVAEGVRDKQRDDELKTAQLITRGTPTARSRAGIDGGMHPVFASKLPEGQAAIDKDVTDYAVASYLPAPGTIPSYATVPKAPDAPAAPVAETAAEPMVAVSTPTTRTASANASAPPSEGFFSRLSRSVGLKSDDKDAAPIQQAQAPVAKPSTPAPKAKPANERSVVEKSADKSSVEQAKSAAPTTRVIPLDRSQQAQTKSEQPAQAAAPAIAGASPTVSSNFESRFSFR